MSLGVPSGIAKDDQRLRIIGQPERHFQLGSACRWATPEATSSSAGNSCCSCARTAAGLADAARHRRPATRTSSRQTRRRPTIRPAGA